MLGGPHVGFSGGGGGGGGTVPLSYAFAHAKVGAATPVVNWTVPPLHTGTTVTMPPTTGTSGETIVVNTPGVYAVQAQVGFTVTKLPTTAPQKLFLEATIWSVSPYTDTFPTVRTQLVLPALASYTGLWMDLAFTFRFLKATSFVFELGGGTATTAFSVTSGWVAIQRIA